MRRDECRVGRLVRIHKYGRDTSRQIQELIKNKAIGEIILSDDSAIRSLVFVVVEFEYGNRFAFLPSELIPAEAMEEELLGMKYVMTPEHPYTEGRLFDAAYCEVLGAVFNRKHERVFDVRWFNSEGERLFEEKCLPDWITPIAKQEGPSMLDLFGPINKGECISLW